MHVHSEDSRFHEQARSVDTDRLEVFEDQVAVQAVAARDDEKRCHWTDLHRSQIKVAWCFGGILLAVVVVIALNATRAVERSTAPIGGDGMASHTGMLQLDDDDITSGAYMATYSPPPPPLVNATAKSDPTAE